MRKVLSKITSNVPGVFYFMKKIDILIHYVFKKQFEPEFLPLKALNGHIENINIVDIGGNIGQSAIGFSILFPKAHITSFEPNEMIEHYLAFCKKLIGDRFRYRMLGFSDQAGSFKLFMPRRGKVLIFGEATLDRSFLETPDVEERIGKFEVEECLVTVVPFDSLGLRPDIVKIDVQGHELSVLQGMQKTIAENSPLFVIECSYNDEEIQKLLREQGYEFYVTNKEFFLVPYGQFNAVNMYCLPVRVAKRDREVGALLRKN